jgi:biotin operon repressor
MGIQGVHVIVEDLQPSLKDYGQKFSLSNTQIEKDVEIRLRAAGIDVFTREQWLKTIGRPLLYINVNTHDDKFRVAYDIRIDLKQIVSMEANPDIKTLAPTWAINMTGMANIDNLDVIRTNVGTLVDRFIKAYWTVNKK